MADLSTLPVQNLGAFDGDIAFVSSIDSLATALRLMTTKNIYSVPVLDASTNTFVALVEINDLVAALLDVHNDTQNVTHVPKLIEERWSKITIQELLQHEDRHTPFQPLPESASIQDAINAMAKSSRRVPVVNAQNQLVQIISPFSIVNFFAHHPDALGDKRSATIRNLGRFSPRVIIADCDTRAIDVFAQMVRSGISGVGIRSREHDLMAVISIKDIRVAVENLSTLLLPVDEYIQIVRKANLRAIAPSIYCSVEDALEKVVAKLSAIRMHRVFLRGEDHKSTVGVLSVWDIVSLFV